MLDVARLAEKLISEGAPSQTKVADAPTFVAQDGEHPMAVSLKKIAHLLRTEGITVQHLDLEDVLSGAAVMKIAADEEAPMGGALSTHPLAIEARAFAAELRKFAADERRAKIASMELELEREIVAHHEKVAFGYTHARDYQSPPREQVPQHGPGFGTLAALGAGAAGAAALSAPDAAEALGPQTTETVSRSFPTMGDALRAPEMPAHPYAMKIDGLKDKVDGLDHDKLVEHLRALAHQASGGAQDFVDRAQDFGQQAYGFGSHLASSIFGGP